MPILSKIKKKNERSKMSTRKKGILITIVLAIASVAVFAAVDTKFAIIVAARDQAAKVIAARAVLQTARTNIQNAHAELLEISKDGSLNLIDAELKATLIKAWQVVKDANTGFSDPNVAKLLDWRPEKKK